MKKIPKRLLTLREKTLEIYDAFDVFIAKLEDKFGVCIKYNVTEVYPVTKVKKKR